MTFPYLLSKTELESISFEAAIAYTEKLLQSVNELTNLELQQAIADLIATANGARGLFVSYMTEDWEIGKQQTKAIIEAIKFVPTPASELIVKNLAMSTAMAIAHRRAGNETQAQGSDRVAARSTELIQLINLDAVKHIASQMQESTQTGEGAYAEFLNKWGYDAEQKAAMDIALAKAIAS
jgi:hypothetical protein